MDALESKAAPGTGAGSPGAAGAAIARVLADDGAAAVVAFLCGPGAPHVSRAPIPVTGGAQPGL